MAERVLAELGEIAPEITGIELMPAVPDIEETIRCADVIVTDTAKTSLAQKGTGIRGGLLVAMLRYLAEASKRSLVLAVEEPESFLHPRAQEAIRSDLEGLAERTDVTLLVTTHSPFVVSAAKPAAVFMIRKATDGSTSCVEEDEQALLGVVRELFDDRLMAKALADALSISIPAGCAAVAVVEGETDVTYLQRAATLHGFDDRLDRIFFDAAGGAEAAALKTLIWRGRCELPVVTLLDHDAPGRSARDLLKRQNSAKCKVLTYYIGREIEDAEAEHLFAPAFVERFLKRHGDDALNGKVRRKDGWAYDLDGAFKEAFGQYVTERARPSDCQLFVPVIEKLLTEAGIA